MTVHRGTLKACPFCGERTAAWECARCGRHGRLSCGGGPEVCVECGGREPSHGALTVPVRWGWEGARQGQSPANA